jgi:hypothetical protein
VSPIIIATSDHAATAARPVAPAASASYGPRKIDAQLARGRHAAAHATTGDGSIVLTGGTYDTPRVEGP